MYPVGAGPAEISNAKSISEANRGRMAGAEFARCIASRSAKRVDAVLAMPNGDAYNRALVGLADDYCLSGGQLRFDSNLFRGALFVQLYRQRSAAEAKGKAWSRSLAPFDPGAPASPVEFGQARLLSFADCVVRRNPAFAREVVLLPTASPGQENAIRQLKNDLAPCFPAGSTMTLSKPVLEGALAEILYRTPAASLTPAAQEKK
jgi:hypothetical protein